MLGDFLYALTPKDEQVTQLQVIAERRVETGAVLEHVISWNIPQGFAFLWKHVLVEAQAGAAQTVSDCTVTVSPVAGGTGQGRHIFTGNGNSFVNDFGSGGRLSRTIPLDLLIPHESALVFRATFSALVNPNTLQSHIHGILIPEGNIALGSLILFV